VEIAEVEVESVAFIVLDALGLTSDDYSFHYVTRRAAETRHHQDFGREVVTCTRFCYGARSDLLMCFSPAI
jgi:hypothetical protein